MVRLKSCSVHFKIGKRAIGLNSIMVRLKWQHSCSGRKHKNSWSQFHYGSIEILNKKNNVRCGFETSQFHYGSIEIEYNLDDESVQTNISLNSIMVRLKFMPPNSIIIKIKEVSIPLWFD